MLPDGINSDFRLSHMKHSQHITYVRAKAMRREPTQAERKLWGALRGSRLCNLKFYRQVPVGPYIVDFICHSHGVVVELDGVTHGEDVDVAYDGRRSHYLESLGLVVHRVWNNDVYKELSATLDGICMVVWAQPKKQRHEMTWLPRRT
jgi:very-short-patch-repair endonuclease